MTGTKGRAASLLSAIEAHRVAVIVGIVALTVAATLFALLAPVHARQMVIEYGYPGVFLVTLLGTAAMVVPVPYLVAIVAGGAVLNPVIVALVAGVAAALGEMVGYFAGVAGHTLLPDTRVVRWLERAMARFGVVVIFVAAFIPNPVFDAVGVLAGAARMPLWMFTASCFLGKTLRFWLVAAGSAAFLGFLGHPDLLG